VTTRKGWMDCDAHSGNLRSREITNRVNMQGGAIGADDSLDRVANLVELNALFRGRVRASAFNVRSWRPSSL
jgi:hypothetical protein